MSSRTRPLVEWSVWMAVLLGGLLVAHERLVFTWVVAGRSMEPGLLAGDRVLVDRWTYRHRAPRVGEVALLGGPGGRPLVKRVAERPGAGFWVLGDHPGQSGDSRQFGAVLRESFRGRLVWRYWPLSRAGPIR